MERFSTSPCQNRRKRTQGCSGCQWTSPVACRSRHKARRRSGGSLGQLSAPCRPPEMHRSLSSQTSKGTGFSLSGPLATGAFRLPLNMTRSLPQCFPFWHDGHLPPCSLQGSLHDIATRHYKSSVGTNFALYNAAPGSSMGVVRHAVDICGAQQGPLSVIGYYLHY
jgi:hypothetical protein